MLLVEHQASNLNALSSRSIFWRVGIHKCSMRRISSDTMLPTLMNLTLGVEALDQHNLVRGHILGVVELVFGIRCNGICLALDGVALCGLQGPLVRQDFLSTIIVVIVVAVGVQKIDLDHVLWLGTSVVDHSEGKVGSGVADGSPDIDDLVAALEKLLCLGRVGVSSDTGFRRAGRLIDMDLLDRLSGAGLFTPADGVIKNNDFLDCRDPLLQKRINLGVVTISHRRFISEFGFFGGGLENVEARKINVEGFETGCAANVDDFTLDELALEGRNVDVDLCPRLD